MDEDEDNDHGDNEHDEDEEDSTIRSYSKRKFFGKTTKSLNLLSLRTNFKFKQPRLKSFKLAVENSASRRGGPYTTYFKLKHKEQYGQVTSKSKFNSNMKNQWALPSWDFSNSLSWKVAGTSLGLNCKLNSKGDLGCKMSHSVKFWEGWKLKYSGDADYKKGKQGAYTGNLTVDCKKSYQGFSWLAFVSNYNQLLGLTLNAKLNSRQKLQAFYKGHISTSQNYKFYLQHKLGYDPSSERRYSNSLTASYQDSLGIGTLNGHLLFENKVLKVKEFRFLIEFEKKWTFGVQKRNQVFELMVYRGKTGLRWLKKVQVSVGNRGFFGSAEGRVNLWRLGVDYTFCYKLKQIQHNLYDDSSFGLKLSCNL